MLDVGVQVAAVNSFNVTPLTALFCTNLFVVFTLELLSNDHDEPLCIKNFKPLSVSPFKLALL